MSLPGRTLDWWRRHLSRHLTAGSEAAFLLVVPALVRLTPYLGEARPLVSQSARGRCDPGRLWVADAVILVVMLSRRKTLSSPSFVLLEALPYAGASEHFTC